MDKTKVVVIMGGISDEHDISLKSGTGIINNIDYDMFEVCPLIIGKDNKWYCKSDYISYEKDPFEIKEIIYKKENCFDLFPECFINENTRPDIVFPILHGKCGEDGSIQGLLEMYNLPYTGSDVLGSALAMNKITAKKIYSFHGLLTPMFSAYNKKNWIHDFAAISKNVIDKLKLPLFAKVINGGSSIGMGFVDNKKNLVKISNELFKKSNEIIFEESISGTEVSCGVIENSSGNIEPLVPTEIVPDKALFFDFDSKYQKGRCQEITPARISKILTEKVQQISVLAHKILCLKGYSRTDMIIKENKIYVLETNTAPGFTETSLMPQQAKAKGIGYKELITNILTAELYKEK